MTSVVTGTALPFCLAKAGVDPANAGTSIQVNISVYLIFDQEFLDTQLDI